jgi:hypothetical protein
MANQMIAEAEIDQYNALRDTPCILCGEPYLYVLGSYIPEETKHLRYREDKMPVLYYTLCEQCFNNGHIPTARIMAAYQRKFGKIVALSVV